MYILIKFKVIVTKVEHVLIYKIQLRPKPQIRKVQALTHSKLPFPALPVAAVPGLC